MNTAYVDVDGVCARAVYSDLYSTDMFEEMSLSADEDEHSIEMQLPYIAKVMERFVTNYCHSVASVIVLVQESSCGPWNGIDICHIHFVLRCQRH